MSLSVSRVVNVTVNLQPKASSRRNFGTLLLLGTSEVISPAERIRSYTNLTGVVADFGVDAPESQAAELYFSQTPRPSLMMVGRWVRNPSPAMLVGAILTPEQQALSRWTRLTDASLTLVVNGTNQAVEGIDLSTAVTLEGIAEILSATLTGAGATCAYDGQRFILSTLAKGEAITLGYASGDLATQMALTETTALAPIPGQDGENLKACVALLLDMSADWYGLAYAATDVADDDLLAVAGMIEAQDKARIMGVTTTDTRTLDATWGQDIASRITAAGFNRTLTAYSRNAYAIISALGRAFTVNFNANRSTITLKFKQLPGIVAEDLKESQVKALEAKRCNVFAAYDNGTAIFQDGVMAKDAWFDEIHGLDWLQNAVQTEVWNLCYQSKNKIPQTDSGVNQIVAKIEQVMAEGIDNLLIAPGIWNGDSFGQLEQGDRLDKGYYIYAPLVDDQPQSEREQRKAPPIQVAVKLGGAIHSVDVLINVNR